MENVIRDLWPVTREERPARIHSRFILDRVFLKPT
jgi:hypothetical protein